MRSSVDHPGVFIKEEIEERGWRQSDLAYILGCPPQAINMIITGKRGISAEMAKALGMAFDVSAEFFVNLQKMYDLSRAQEPDSGIAKRARFFQNSYPVREMIMRGWLEDAEPILLADIDTAPRSHMVRAFSQRRKQIVGDCHQLKVDVDHYNGIRSDDLPIQMVFDFTEDLTEIEALEVPKKAIVP